MLHKNLKVRHNNYFSTVIVDYNHRCAKPAKNGNKKKSIEIEKYFIDIYIFVRLRDNVKRNFQ